MLKTLRFATVVSLLLLGNEHTAFAVDVLRMATTTSTDNTGLLQVLNPPFETAQHIRVDVIAMGTGKALRLAENGDVDLVLVHAPDAEKGFVAMGYGVKRFAVMHNDFVLLGPKQDPAGAKQAQSASAALMAILRARSDFVSRGDDSGTHKKEKAFWRQAGITPNGNWYISAGQGMGAVLRMANDKNAYTLCDRGTYLVFKDKLEIVPVYEGSADLFNPYHVIAVNPRKHPHVRFDLASQYINYLTGSEGQEIINNFSVGGQALFHPDAKVQLSVQ